MKQEAKHRCDNFFNGVWEKALKGKAWKFQGETRTNKEQIGPILLEWMQY